MKRLFAFAVLLLFSAHALAGSVGPRDGWQVFDTDQTYQALIANVKEAARAEGMGVVTEAGPTGAAKARGVEIPGNRVIGVFNNKFAVSVLRLSVPAMIEAPIRLYVTEDEDGTATLSYKMPSTVFEPYIDEAGEELEAIAAELDAIFRAIARRAVEG